MRLGMAVLTAACVLLGLFPTAFIRLLDPLTQQLIGVQISGQLSLANGLVLGSREFVDRVFDLTRKWFGQRRTSGARKLARVVTELRTMRALKVRTYEE